MIRSISICALLASGFSLLNAAQPYALRPELDLPLAAGLVGMKYNSGAMLTKMRESPRDISALNRNQIPAYDRWAIGFYSPKLSAMSSVVAGSELLIPAAVNLWDTFHGYTPWQGMLVDAVILEEALTLSSALSDYSKSIP